MNIQIASMMTFFFARLVWFDTYSTIFSERGNDFLATICRLMALACH